MLSFESQDLKKLSGISAAEISIRVNLSSQIFIPASAISELSSFFLPTPAVSATIAQNPIEQCQSTNRLVIPSWYVEAVSRQETDNRMGICRHATYVSVIQQLGRLIVFEIDSHVMRTLISWPEPELQKMLF